MAVTVDVEDYARVVLICSGHFNDPNLEGRLTDIRRRLHMLTTGYTRILFFNSFNLQLVTGIDKCSLCVCACNMHSSKFAFYFA